jgi:L-alanine-DL-glutamate epimerase-like enolase superfamily enzyme
MTRADAVERVVVRTFTVPTDAPEADGTAEWDSTTAVVAEVHTADAVGTGWSYTPAAAAQLVRDVAAPVITGRSVHDVPALWFELARATRNAGRAGVVAGAISAVDIALWDAKARLLDISLLDLLGASRDAAPVYGSGGFTTYPDDRTEHQVRGWLEQGIRAVKIKIGESFGRNVQRDLHRIALVRRIVGDDVEVFVDANGGYSVAQARRVEHAMRRWDVRWFEEPVSSDDPRGLADVRANALADIAAGEYVYRSIDAHSLVTAGAVDCLQLDVTRCGGITGWMRLAAYAQANELDVSAHCAPQLSAHVVCAAQNARHLEYFHDHSRLEPMLFDGVQPVVDGSIAPDRRLTGHGMRLRDAAAEYEVS